MFKNNFFPIFLFELKKLMRNRLMIAAFLIILAFDLAVVISDGSKWTKEERKSQKAIAGRVLDAELFGELKQELYGEGKENRAYAISYGAPVIADGNNVYSHLSYYVGQIFREDYADRNIDDFYARIDAVMEENLREDYACSEGEIAFWRKKQQKIERPFVWYDADHLENMRNVMSTYGIMGLLFAAVSLSSVFAREYGQLKTGQMVFCTRNGKQTVYFAKILAGCVLLAGFTVLILAAVVITGLLYYGTDGLLGAVQLKIPYTPFAASYLELFGMYLGLTLVTGVFYAMISMVLSQVLKNGVAVMGAMIGGTLFLYAMINRVSAGTHRAVAQALFYQPITVLQDFYYEYRTVPIGGHYFPVYQAAPAIYLLIAVWLMFVGLRSQRAAKTADFIRPDSNGSRRPPE